MNLQVSPSFEIDHLATKDFVTGLASPIDPKFVKYWLDRGLDRRLVLLLFFSAVEITDEDSHTSIRIRNAPRDALEYLEQMSQATRDDEELRCDNQSDFQHYLRFINTLTTFSANSYTERRKFADGLHLEFDASSSKPGAESAIKDLGTIADLDPTKFQWVRDPNRNSYTIYAISSEPKTALCDSGYQLSTSPETPARQTPCSTTVYTVPVGGSSEEYHTFTFPPINKQPDKRSDFCGLFDKVVKAKETEAAQQGIVKNSAKRGLRLEIRSVGEIIQFLGDLQEYQEQHETLSKKHPEILATLNNPLTFGYCRESKVPGCNDIFFHLRHDSCNVRFALTYRHRRYSVPNYNGPDDSDEGSSMNACTSADESSTGGRGPTTAKDHTLEVLAVVHQLVDLQKSAQDIKQTPYVQLLP